MTDENSDDHAPQESPRGRIASFIWRATLSLGWLVFFGVLFLLIIEKSGALRLWLEEDFNRRLGPSAGSLRLGAAEIAWLERKLVLSDIAFGDERDIVVDSLNVTFGLRSATPIEYVELVGGHLRLSRPLLDEVREVFQSRSESRGSKPGRIPTLVVSSFAVAIETTEWGELPLGRVDARLRDEPSGMAILEGHLVPALAARGAEQGELFLSGVLDDEGLLEVTGRARQLPLDMAMVPAGVLNGLRQLSPTGVVDLEAHARYTLGESVYPAIEAELRVSQGGLVIPWTASDVRDAASVEDVAVMVSAAFDPDPDRPLWVKDAGSVTAMVSGTWASEPAQLWIRYGRSAGEGSLADAWVHAPEVTLDDGLLQLLSPVEWIENGLWKMLAPGGATEMAVSLRLPETWTPTPGASFADSVERAIGFYPGGRGASAYHGNPGPDGQRNLGFPLQLEDIDGRVVYAFDAQRRFPEQLGIFDIRARAGAGRALVQCSIHGQPDRLYSSNEPREHAFYLHSSATDLAVDAELEKAFAGLSGLIPPSELWDQYRPQGGRLGFDLDMWYRLPGLPRLTSRIDIELRDAGLEWAKFPVPVASANLDVAFRNDASGHLGVMFSGRATSPAARDGVLIAGRAESGPEVGELQHLVVDASGLNLRSGVLGEVLAQHLPAVQDSLQRSRAGGFCSLSLEHVMSAKDAPAYTFAEIETEGRGLTLSPQDFPLQTRDVQGRILVKAETPPQKDGQPTNELEEAVVSFRIEPLIGRWGTEDAPVPVAIRGGGSGTNPPVLQLFGAGIDTANRAVLGALSTAVGVSSGTERGLDFSGLNLEGEVDFSAIVEVLDASQNVPATRFKLHLRHASFGTRPDEVPFLTNIDGQLLVEDGVAKGDRLRAILGKTPVELSDFRVSGTEEETLLVTRIRAQGLPLDYEHLRFFLDEDTLEGLLDELQWRGQMEIEDGRIEYRTLPGGETTLRFSGKVRLASVFVRMGVPISIQTAVVSDLDLFLEGDRVRGWARVRDLFGQVAGRRLDDASFLLTYVEPHLAIDDLDGNFEDGELHSLGLEDARGGSFFSIDLVPPFPFWLSAEMLDVDVGDLLRGVFNSDFANEGRLGGRMRLRGDIESLTKIEGSGFVQLEDSSLWSIPVFQALFAQLGFDTTATFQNMECHFRIAEGRINMTQMRLKSDLLSLVGEGWITLESRLHHDLEVRYSLVDKLGPFTLLLYKIQNSLLRVSIRGDMSRPQVVLRGFLSQFFRKVDEGYIQLPLPGFSELPARF